MCGVYRLSTTVVVCDVPTDFFYSIEVVPPLNMPNPSTMVSSIFAPALLKSFLI